MDADFRQHDGLERGSGQVTWQDPFAPSRLCVNQIAALVAAKAPCLDPGFRLPELSPERRQKMGPRLRPELPPGNRRTSRALSPACPKFSPPPAATGRSAPSRSG